MTKEFIREEEDGSTTTTSAIEMDGVLKTHSHKGPAIVNKEQKIKEYYSYGINVSKEVWEKKKKLSQLMATAKKKKKLKISTHKRKKRSRKNRHKNK